MDSLFVFLSFRSFQVLIPFILRPICFNAQVVRRLVNHRVGSNIDGSFQLVTTAFCEIALIVFLCLVKNFCGSLMGNILKFVGYFFRFTTFRAVSMGNHIGICRLDRIHNAAFCFLENLVTK